MKKIAFAAPLVAALLLGLWLLRAWRAEEVPPSPERIPAARTRVDPRLDYQGSYRNVHPDVAYVGDAACVQCHPKEHDSFRRHPMGRSTLPIAQAASSLPRDTGRHNPFDALGSRFLIERRGDRVWQRHTGLDGEGRPYFEQDVEIQWAIGSGTLGFSCLIDRDGYLFQAPVSWFTQKQIWDLSPGFENRLVTERPVTRECLFCHANRAHPLPGYQNRYARPIFSGHVIGCERCHGPGERHIQSGDPLDIVNPIAARLPDAAVRDAVCAQCHLEGVARVLRRGRDWYDFRPGLPLEPFWSVFVYPDEGGSGRAAVNHFEQMYQSRCYQNTPADGKLGCVSCHNPHEPISGGQRVAYYRRRCLECHSSRGCRLPAEERLSRNKEDSCIACHMPHSDADDVAHTATTDHRIPRRKRNPPPAANRPILSGGFALVPFSAPSVDPRDGARIRDLALALVRAASSGQIELRRAAVQAQVLLDSVLADDPEDVEAWEACGGAYLLQRDAPRALQSLRKALARQPANERVLVAAATEEHNLDQTEEALAHWRQAVALNPWMANYRRHLALLLVRKASWEEAHGEARAWLRLAPASLEARMLEIRCLLHEGKKAEARAEFARIEALRPPDLERWRTRFQQLMESPP